MKNLIFILLVTFTFNSQAQVDYFKDSTSWRVSSFNGSNPNCLWTYEKNYVINGDSTFNGKTYKKLYTYVKFWNYFQDPICGNSGETYGLTLLRQDSLKIYQINGGNEELLYDFDLDISDTIFEPNNPQPNYIYTVKSIDTVFINNQPRRRFWTGDSLPFCAYLIEGVGHSNGFLENFEIEISAGSQLNCHKYNNVIYPIRDSGICNFELSIPTNAPGQSDLVLFPNPTNNFIEIRHEEEILELKLLDLTGNVLYSDKSYKNGKIDLSSFENGTYLVSIKTKRATTWKKVVKN